MDDNTLDPNTQNQPTTDSDAQVPQVSLETGEITEPTQVPTITYIPDTGAQSDGETMNVEMPVDTVQATEEIQPTEFTTPTEVPVAQPTEIQSTETADTQTYAQSTQIPSTEMPGMMDAQASQISSDTPVETVSINPTNNTEKTTKILKTAVPIIVALVVVVGGYFAYSMFFGGSNTASMDQASGDVPNFLNSDASEEIPGDYQDALEELMESQSGTSTEDTTDTTISEETSTEDTTTDTPQSDTELTDTETTTETTVAPVEEQPKVKVPRS